MNVTLSYQRLATLVAGSAWASTAVTAQNWSFSHVGYLGPPGVFGVPVDVDVAANGFHVAVADVGRGTVLSFAADGRLRWRSGEPGGGVGQFGAIAQVAALRNGGVAAYDSRRQRVLFFGPSGEFITEPHLPFTMARVDDLVSLADGRLAMAGRTAWEGRDAHRFAIHVFTGRLDHLMSFGPLPEVEDQSIALAWGVGSLRRSRDNLLLLGRKIPYEVVAYTEQGDLVYRVSPAITLPYGVDAIWRVEQRDDGTTSRVLSGLPVEIPSGAMELASNAIFSQRTIQGSEERYWDIFRRDGTVMYSGRAPPHAMYPYALTPEGGRLFVLSQRDGEPAIAVISVDFGGP